MQVLREGRGLAVLHLLSVVALLAPLLLLGAFATWSYQEHFRQAEARLGATLDQMHEHGSKVFETYDLLASYTDELLQTLSDEEIRAQEPTLNAKLKKFVVSLPQVQDVWAVGADGRPLVTANVFPVPRNLDLSDRAYYAVQKDRDAGLYISEVLRGRAQDVTFFQFSRRRAAPDGSFQGVIAVSVQPNYFRDYYAQIAANRTITGAALQRLDGAILAIHPDPRPLPPGPPALGPTGGLRTAVRDNPERGTYRTRLATDGIERIVAYAKLANYPVYVSVGLRTPLVQQGWLWSLAWPFALGVPAALGLFGLSRLALDYTQRESAALSALRDETRRREAAEAERRKTDALHRAYYNNTSDSLFVIRVLPDGRFTVEDRNPAHAQAFGIDIEAVRGKELHEFMPADLADKVVASYRRCVEADAPIRFETKFDTERGASTWETVLAPVHDETGRITHIVGASRDVSERLELEEKLRQAQKMEALGALTGGMAHDFNNLLTIIMGNLDLLRRAKQDRMPRLIDSALQAVEQGRKLTAQLLAFGRRQPLRPEVVDPKAVLVGMGDMLAQSLRGDIDLEFELAEKVWAVEVDRSQLHVALINLAANARDAMPGGGKVVVKVENAAMPDRPDAEAVAISLCDTGHGMPRDVQARAFEPFFTTKDVGKGTGLGLAQVYGFAQQSGGTVELQSEPGHGTTLTVYLPRANKAVRRLAPSAPYALVSTRSLRILVVDDNPDVGEVAASLLAERGHTVTRALTADQALALLESAPGFDLVFSDLVMPGSLDGLGLARILRERWPAIPVLLATGYSDAATRASDEGFRLLNKPYAPSELLRAIAELSRRPAEV